MAYRGVPHRAHRLGVIIVKKLNPYDERYAGQEYYWGKSPSAICDRVIEIIGPHSGFRPKLLDLGCGEGRNAVHFARHGFDVVGIDLSPPGLEKTRRYARDASVRVETIHADIVDYEFDDPYNVIFSTGALQYLPREIRTQRFQHYKDHTSAKGVNAFSVLVTKPFLPIAPDAEDTATLFRSGELMGHYWDWEILYSIEEIFNCTSSGVPHRHAVNRIIARRYSDDE